MRHSNRELWAALIAILLISILYLLALAWLGSVPAASEFFGHSLGIVGFIMMLMTETLYTMRKRSRAARWGKMSSWLEFHIFTGIVGPFMVLLHSAWKLNGLAGVTLLLTGVVVASGFVGRYIYTSVPRTADGVEVEADALQRLIQTTRGEISRWLAQQDPGSRLAAQLNAQLSSHSHAVQHGMAAFWLQGIAAWQRSWEWRLMRWRMPPAQRGLLAHFEKLLGRYEDLRSQLAALAMARRLLAVWHAVHIPIGMALFTAAGIHIIAAFYYATLLRLWD